MAKDESTNRKKARFYLNYNIIFIRAYQVGNNSPSDSKYYVFRIQWLYPGTLVSLYLLHSNLIGLFRLYSDRASYTAALYAADSYIIYYSMLKKLETFLNEKIRLNVNTFFLSFGVPVAKKKTIILFYKRVLHDECHPVPYHQKQFCIKRGTKCI